MKASQALRKLAAWSAAALCLGLVSTGPAGGAWAEEPGRVGREGDRTLSPYFFVQSDDPETDRLPLKSTRAAVTISGVIAEVRLTQVYQNQGRNTLEAIYVFPASSRAAVHSMKMTVGQRVIEARIKEREQARRDYEQAQSEGRTASLLEQQRPNVFTMNLANIRPGDEIKVELSYTELLIPEAGLYEFVYPGVVGPRYSSARAGDAPSSEEWLENPYLHQDQDSPFTFGLDLSLTSPIPIAQVLCPSHRAEVKFGDPRRVQVSLPQDREAGRRDFVLRYSLAGEKIQSGLLLYQGREENYFLLMMEPPARIGAGEIVPREYIFVVDVSGSMHGFPLDISRKLMADLLAGLRQNDCFNMLLFSGGNEVLAERSLPASPANLQRALEVLGRRRGGGGTELLPALKRALALPQTEGMSRIVVVITDGYVSVEKEAFELIQANLNRANLFSFGIGRSVNRFLIEGLARAGQGEPLVIMSPAQAQAEAARFREYISSPVLQGLRVKVEGLRTSDLEPEVLPDLFARRPLILFGKYQGRPQGRIVISGHAPGSRFESVIDVSAGLASDENAALARLWARQRIARLADLNRLGPSDGRVKEVTGLGLKYSLMTDYTSFVAVDTEIRADGTRSVTVKQPLPLPHGVSDLAVGGVAPAPMSGLVKRAAGRPGFLVQSEAAAVKDKDPRVESKEEVREGERGRPAGRGWIGLSLDRVGGGWRAAEVVESIGRQRAELEECYRGLLRKFGPFGGAMTVELEVDGQGRAAAVRILSTAVTTPGSTPPELSLELGRNIVEILRKVRLDRSVQAQPATIRLTLKFENR